MTEVKNDILSIRFRGFIKKLDLNNRKISLATGISQQYLGEVLNGKKVVSRAMIAKVNAVYPGTNAAVYGASIYDTMASISHSK